jgi:DNA-binding transcriptional ArsR family regulator
VLPALEIVESPEAAAPLLHPERRRILEMLAEPDSASGLARRLHVSRQVVNYHLRELERTGLVTLAEERRKGNCIERLVRRTASAYVIGPSALGTLGADPEAVADKLSAAYLTAVSARTIRELSRLGRAAQAAGKTLATLTLDTEIRFRNARERSEFTEELAACMAALVRRYHDASAPGGRRFRVLAGAYPLIPPKEEKNANRNAGHPAA